VGWYVAVAGGAELTGVNTGVPSVVYAMRTLCRALEDGGVGGLFGSPNGSLAAITPCSEGGLTSIIPPLSKRAEAEAALQINSTPRDSWSKHRIFLLQRRILAAAKRTRSFKNP
jgi:hypothetical protein